MPISLVLFVDYDVECCENVLLDSCNPIMTKLGQRRELFSPKNPPKNIVRAPISTIFCVVVSRFFLSLGPILKIEALHHHAIISLCPIDVKDKKYPWKCVKSLQRLSILKATYTKYN